MSLLYDLLKEKATNPETRDKIAYVEIPRVTATEHHRRYGNLRYFQNYKGARGFTYANFFDLVSKYIESHENNFSEFSFPNIFSLYDDSKILRVDVGNNIASAAAIIALLECDYIPIICDETVATSVFQDRGKWPPSFEITYRKIAKMINASPKKHEADINGDHIFLICSSGSEGENPHLNMFTEKSLVNSKIQYGDEDSTFYSYISNGNISGFLANVINPIVHGTTTVCETRFNLDIFHRNMQCRAFDNEVIERCGEFIFSSRNRNLQETLIFDNFDDSKVQLEDNKIKIPIRCNLTYSSEIPGRYKGINYKCGTIEDMQVSIDSIMFPRDILDYLEKHDSTIGDVDLSHIKHIYLAGGVNRQEVIDTIRAKIPSIPTGVFENLYGATEAGGVICSCSEKDLTPCFINVTNYKNDGIVYTYDKKTFYKLTKEGKSDISCEFNELDFVSYLPVSNQVEPNVMIDDDFTIRFRDADDKKWIESSDFGIYIDNKLYVLGRKKALINIGEKYHFINTLEEYFSRILGARVLLAKDKENLGYHIYLDGEKTRTLAEKIELYKRAFKFSSDFTIFKLGLPIIISHDNLPISRISGKISRPQLLCFEEYALVHFDDVVNTDQAKRKFLNDYVADNIYKKYYEATIKSKNRVQIKCCNGAYLFPNFMANRFFKIIYFDDENGVLESELND